MADSKVSPENTDPIAGADPHDNAPAQVPSNDMEKHPEEEHVENSPSSDSGGSLQNLHRKGALGFIQQQHTIPTTGSVMPTGKWEYIFFCIYCSSAPQIPMPVLPS